MSNQITPKAALKLLGWIFGFLLVYTGQAQSLEALQELALKTNPQLKASFHQFEAAMTKIDQSKALADPNLSFGAFIAPVETRVGPQRARLSISQMFPWFGTLDTKASVATLQAEAAYQQFEDLRLQIQSRVAKAYVPLLALQEQISITRSNQEVIKSLRKMSLARVESGKGNLVDVLRADRLLNEISTEIATLNLQIPSLLQSLYAVIGTDTLTLSANDRLSRLIKKPSATDWATNHPAIQAYELSVEAADHQHAYAKKLAMPKIGVGLDYVIVGKRSDMAVADNGKDALMPMLAISLPIYQKKYKALEQEAKYQQAALSASRLQAINDLKAAHARQTYLYRATNERLKLIESQIIQTQQIIDLETTAYANSQGKFEDLLQAQTELLTLQKQRVALQSTLVITLQEINYLTAKSIDK